MNRARLKTRAALLAGACALVGVSDVNAAHAANGGTTHEFVHHASGRIAAEAWFNSGTANLAKGRNSFTIKDDFCRDGWAIEIEYYWYDTSGYEHDGAAYEPTDCSGSSWEDSFSIAGAQSTSLTFYWHAGKWDVNGISADTWEPWIQTTIS